MAATTTEGAKRSYRSATRSARALETRRKVLAAARDQFMAQGYAGTTMRAVAAAAGVSVPTVELAFGTKASLLKASIDVAIAGDDEQVPVLDRGWAASALSASSVEELLTVVTGVLADAQQRSAGLVLAAFEGSSADPELAAVTDQLVAQRETTARWLVERIAAAHDLREGLTRTAAVDTVWLLMDPAVFVRLTRDRRWSRRRYRDWIATCLRNLLLPDSPAPPTTRT